MTINELVKLVNTLRKKCPWDRKQTLSSLKNSLVEETYEVVEAIEENRLSLIKEEIGDLLFLGIFLAKVLEEEKGTSFNQLISETIKKYRDKHPHVFSKRVFTNTDEVIKFWQQSKNDVFQGISISLPALLAARVIQERAARLGFDWHSHKGPLKKIKEELREIKRARKAKKVFEEFGDLLFSCVNLARHLEVDPEDALRYANKKFVNRFRKVKEKIEKNGKNLEDVNLKEMDRVWNEIKE